MKTALFACSLAVLFLGCLVHADDIRLANGRVLRNVTVNRISSDGVVVTPQGFGATATIYYWRYLHPEDAARLQATREKEDRQAASLAELEKASVLRAIQVTQVRDNGVLAHLATAHAVLPDRNIPQNKGSETNYRRDGDWQDEVVFIYLKNTKQMVDGEKSAGRLYPVGRLQYTTVLGATNTVRAYAISPEHAVEIIRSRASKPNDE